MPRMQPGPGAPGARRIIREGKRPRHRAPGAWLIFHTCALGAFGLRYDYGCLNQRAKPSPNQTQVESGKYSSTDDVIGNALALLDEHDEALESELAEMRESVRRGTEQADTGQVVPAEEVFEELRGGEMPR